MKEKSLFRQFSEYVSFNVLAMISISLYILADTFFVSAGIGLNGLTSLNLALPVFSFISAVSMMIGMGGATLFSLVKSGRGDEQAKNVYTVVSLFGLVISLVLVAVGAFFNQPLAVAFGAKAHILADTAVYIKYSLIFAPAFILSRIFISFVRNNGSPMLSMMAMIVGSLSNIVLDYIFIFPCNMGMLGAVIATCLAPVVSIIVVIPYLLKDKGALKFVVPTKVLRLCRQIIKLGVTPMITELSWGLVMTVFNFIILSISGNMGVAAYSVISNITFVTIAIFAGIAQGSQPLISQNFGRGQHFNVCKILKYTYI